MFGILNIPAPYRKKSRALAGYPALLPHKEEKGVTVVYSGYPYEQ